MNKKILFIVLTSLALCACTIRQTVEPSGLAQGDELCIVENPKVRSGFIFEFQSALAERGIRFKMVDSTSTFPQCEWTARYVARWSWDITVYMAYAEIKIFRNGHLDGEAIYDSTGGSSSFAKWIDAKPKIHELVNELLAHY